jgi:hypothetical protein
MQDIFMKTSYYILQNPHIKGTRSHHAWNIWLKVVRSGLISPDSDAPGREFEKLTAKCGSNRGPQGGYYPRIYRFSRSVTNENLI